MFLWVGSQAHGQDTPERREKNSYTLPMSSPRRPDAKTIMALLKSDEELLWHARPKPVAYAMQRWGIGYLIMSPVSIALGFWNIWSVSQGITRASRPLRGLYSLFSGEPHGLIPQHHPFGYAQGVMWIVVGFAVGIFFAMKWKEGRDTVYAITSHRVLRILTGPNGAGIAQVWGGRAPLERLVLGRGALIAGYIWLGQSFENARRRFFKVIPWNDGIIGLANPSIPFEILKGHPKAPKAIAKAKRKT